MSNRPSRPIKTPFGVSSGGYTLVEVLVAVTLTLILMTAIVKVFAGVGDGISQSKKTLETFDRLRLAEGVLRQDLQGITVSTIPPWKPEAAQGYFEYIESGYADPKAMDLDPNDDSRRYNQPDNTPGQRGDILMFTTRSITKPFIGRFANPTGNQTMQSDVAEVAWFLRGRTLHRRVLLVAPGTTSAIASAAPSTFYQNYDVSVHRSNNGFVANNLSDLARRENRFAHPTGAFPFDVRSQWGILGLPTMRECADATYMGGIASNWSSGSFPSTAPGPTASTISQVDMWQPFCTNGAGTTTYWLPDYYLSQGAVAVPSSTRNTARDADDIILTNVIEFDVKAWDPDAGAYVDLGYGGSTRFGGNGNTNGRAPLYRVYDTYPQSYESEGAYHFNGPSPTIDLAGGRSNNGFDDAGAGLIDGPADQITWGPYPYALRGIQIKIRVFEPSSRQILERTIEHDFLPK